MKKLFQLKNLLQNLKTINKYSKILFIFIIMCGCDFRSQLHKDILKAQKHIENKEYQKAVNVYKKCLEKNPQSKIKDKINFQIAEINLIYLNEAEIALVYFNNIVNSSNDINSIIKSLEQIAEINSSAINNYEKSIKIYLKLLNFTPKLEKYDLYEFSLAKSYVLNYEKELAEKILTKIIKNKSHKYYVESLRLKGLNNFQNKEWKKAIKNWEEYLKFEDNKNNITEIKFLIANCYETLEELKIAYNLYYSILGEYPNTQIILNRLESIYNRKVARKR